MRPLQKPVCKTTIQGILRRGLVLLLMLTPVLSPSDASAQSATICVQDHTIIPGVRIGEVAYGMSFPQVVAAWGRPASLGWFPGDHKMLSAYGRLGVAAITADFAASHTLFLTYTDFRAGGTPGEAKVRVSHDKVDWVMSISLPSSVASCQTTAGIRIGSAVSDVLKGYGTPSGTFETATVHGKITLLAYDMDAMPGGIVFVISDNIVRKITIFPHGSCLDLLAKGCPNLIF